MLLSETVAGLNPIVISDSDEDGDTVDRYRTFRKEEGIAGVFCEGASGYTSDKEADKFPPSNRPGLSCSKVTEMQFYEDEEEVGAGLDQDANEFEDDSPDYVPSEDSEDSPRYPKRTKRRKHVVNVSRAKSVALVDPKKRIFSYKKKNYCYSPAVFSLILDLPNKGLGMKELVIKFGKEEMIKHFGRGSGGRKRFPIEQFHNFGSPKREEDVKVLLRKWVKKLYHNENKCSKSVVVAAMHVVQGRMVKYPQYLSDLLHSRAATSSSKIWCLCSAVMEFHNNKKDSCKTSDGSFDFGINLVDGRVDGSFSSKAFQQPKFENNVKNATALKDKRPPKPRKPSDPEPHASTNFACKVEEQTLGGFVVKKEDGCSGNGGRDQFLATLMNTLRQVKTVLYHDRKVIKERVVEKQELERTIRERDEEHALLERNLQRFLGGTRELQEKLKRATDFIEKSNEDLGELQKKHDDFVNIVLRWKRQKVEKADLAKRHKTEEEELLKDVGTTARDLKGIMKNCGLFDPATPH